MLRQAMPLLLSGVLLIVQGLSPVFAARMQATQLSAIELAAELPVAHATREQPPCHGKQASEASVPDASEMSCCGIDCHCPELCSTPAGIAVQRLALPATYGHPEFPLAPAPGPLITLLTDLLRPPRPDAA